MPKEKEVPQRFQTWQTYHCPFLREHCDKRCPFLDRDDEPACLLANLAFQLSYFISQLIDKNEPPKKKKKLEAKTPKKMTCANCGSTITDPTSNQKYCSGCQKEMKRKVDREYRARKRAENRDQT